MKSRVAGRSMCAVRDPVGALCMVGGRDVEPRCLGRDPKGFAERPARDEQAVGEGKDDDGS